MTEFLSDNPELELITKRLTEAVNPEEIFGSLEGVDDRVKAGRVIYRHLSRATYPDLFPDATQKARAEAAFKKLHELWESAQAKLDNGTYGVIDTPKADTILVDSRHRRYRVSGQAHQRGFSNTYLCNFSEDGVDTQAIFKVVRDPADNDLLENEARILKTLASGRDFDKFHHYFPTLVESFSYLDTNDPLARTANILSYADSRLFSLEEVHETYPAGIDPKDMAWIYRRLLVGAGFANSLGIIHGALLPYNILVQDQKHGLVLNEWSSAVINPRQNREYITALDAGYLDWYPAEVMQRRIPTPALDIYLAAETMVYLLGGEPTTGILPTHIPGKLEQFLRHSLHPEPNRRPSDSWQLLEEFDHIIKELWGPRKFHPFSMPAGTNSTFW